MCLHTYLQWMDYDTVLKYMHLYGIISSIQPAHMYIYVRTHIEQGEVEYALAVIGLRMYIVQSTSSELASVVVGGDLMSVSLHVCQMMSLPVPAPLPCPPLRKYSTL